MALYYIGGFGEHGGLAEIAAPARFGVAQAIDEAEEAMQTLLAEGGEFQRAFVEHLQVGDAVAAPAASRPAT